MSEPLPRAADPADLDDPADAANAADPAPPPAATPQWQPLALEFTGSGSEYFRIWIVNLLLVVLTFTLYLPFAKARRLRYFHGNTLVGGHALGFHGNGWRMLRGHLLMSAFALAYLGAGLVSPWSAAVAGLALVLLWPALWQASLRFRLANTSWRGLRLRFSGSLGGAYRATLPGLLPAVPLAVFYPLFASVGEGAPPVLAWAGVAAGVSLLVLVAVAPWLGARMKRYQHGHYVLAGDTTTLDATAGDFYRLSGRGGLWMVGLVLVTALAALLVFAGGQALEIPRAALLVASMLIAIGFYGGMLALQPWAAARLQNLVWSRTHAPRLRVQSQLSPQRMVLLAARNLVLTLLSLGLYRPFAVVAMAQLRLQAISLQSLGDPAQWFAPALRPVGDASGEAAADLLGVDVGL